MLSSLSALLPIALYLLLMRAFDAFSMVKWRSIGLWLLWGAASALSVLALSRGYQFLNGGQPWHGAWISPLLEEGLKVAPLAAMVLRRRVAFLAETLLFGQAIGGGFALVENLIYLTAFPDMMVGTALVRGLGTTLLHMGCTSVAASLVLSVKMLMAQRRRVDTPLLLHPLSCVCLLPSLLIHIAHNTLQADPMTQVVSLIVLFFALFYLLSIINERIIIRWLDISINDDVALLGALRQGRLMETKGGQYLCSLRERFDQLTFFDMTAYVLLYLQLLIAAKSRMMLQDAGIDMPLSDEERTLRREQIAELETLSRRIPRMGHAVLQPLIHASDQNRWALSTWKSC